MSEDPNSSINLPTSPLRDIFNGSIAGALGKIIEYPFDTVKVRLQTQGSHIFPNAWSCIQYTYKNEGVLKGFFQGISSPIFGASLENATLFVSYNQTSKLLNRHFKTISDLNNILISGAVAGSCASFVLTPVELIKCKLQIANLDKSLTKNINNTKVSHTILSISKEKRGVLGLWQGQSSTFIRESLGGIVWFATYELLKKTLRERHGGEENKTWELLFSGASAGVAFNGSIFPVDTVKSVMQTEQISLTKAVLKIFRKRGIPGFYRGLGITLIRAIPANATVFYIYETLSKM